MYKLEYLISNSISKGLAWLARNQNADGSFGSIYTLTTTALAVQAFENYAKQIGKSPLSPDYKYYYQINQGLKYIINSAQVDSNGIYFEENGNISMPTGAVLGALASLGCPTCTLSYPGSTLDGYTVGDVVNGMINYLALSQNSNGGWGAISTNYDNYDTSTNSNSSSFVTGGLYFAQLYGYNVPQSVKDNLQLWVDSIQNSSGGAGNYGPCEGVNISNTAILIQQMQLLGYSCDDPSLKCAEMYIADNWCCPVGYLQPGWNDCENIDYQAAYETMVALSKCCVNYLETSCCSKICWFENIVEVLIYKQNRDGSWPASEINYDQSESVITTVWAVLTLEAAISKINLC